MGTDRVFAADLQALRPQVGQALSAANLTRVLAGSGVMAGHREDRFHRVQDAYSLRCSPQVHGAARDTVEHAATVAGRELASAVDNPVVLVSDRRAGPGRVERQLPRRPGRLRPRLPGHRRRRRGLDLRAPQRPLPRPRAQPRPAAVPRRRPRRRQRPDDRAVHPGRDRLRAQAARGAGQRRLDPVERDAGGPRVDGLVRRPQAASVGRRADPGGRDRAADRGPRARPADDDRRHRRHVARAGDRRRRTPAASSTASGLPAPTATSRPRSRPPSRWSRRAPSCPPSKK